MALIFKLSGNYPVHSDPEKRAERFQPGDVLRVLPDDWVFGAAEINNPMFEIVKVPDASVADLIHLEQPEMTKDARGRDVPVSPSSRKFKLDMPQLEKEASFEARADAKLGSVKIFSKADVAKHNVLTAQEAVAEEIVGDIKP